MPRFVILRHELPDATERSLHWDVMLEAGDILMTWALQQEPEYGVAIAATQLANHRREYLNYEGPISGGRGVVNRWDQGEFVWRRLNADECIASLRGEILIGEARFKQSSAGDQRWVVWFAEDLSSDD